MVPLEFVLFGATLMGVALLHRHTLRVALTGLGAITCYKVLWSAFPTGAGVVGLVSHVGHEAVVLLNLGGLLLGFAILSRHFEHSHLTRRLVRVLPGGWACGLGLLVLIFVLSSFLDNIAAALIGGAIAHEIFRGKVHIGYLAGIVAAANAGGSGSVIGDTTTTMMWIDHVSPMAVFHAYVAAVVALLVCGVPAALQQFRYSRPLRPDRVSHRVDWPRVWIVVAVLVAAIVTNVTINTHYRGISGRWPFLATAVWATILFSSRVRRPDWQVLPGAASGALFLLALVLSASMMPVESLPTASWQTALSLGFVSAVFDNIPLTALALQQGGYDWGVLAYAVGFGGSMIWFGSSAGVALSALFPEARSAVAWLRFGWHVTIAYVLGFFVLLFVMGWNPTGRELSFLPTIWDLTRRG